jgi:hypothetical protein
MSEEQGKNPHGDSEGHDPDRGGSGDWTAAIPGGGNPERRTQEHKVWSSILRRLGGSSPGSEENLQLADLFSRVQFPADRDGVLNRLAPEAEIRLREGIVVDLRQAVERSRAGIFRSLGDLVDCVKDELRRQEADGKKLLRMV